MNLNTITEVKRPQSADQITQWRPGYAWLAGGTWLFSEPQFGTDTLIDLQGLRWPALTPSASGLEIAATCHIAELFAFSAPPEWRAAPLIRDCCNAFLASFKIWNASTVGGNICMSLPAGPMISLTAALEGVYTLWPRDGAPREVAAVDFVTGDNANILAPGELLRSILLPASALSKRFAFRHASMTKLGRSAALIVGTQGEGDLLLTITAATPRPIQFYFPEMPPATALRRAIDARIPADGYFNDVHGSAAYKRHLTLYFAEQIRAELAAA
ncbi:MULTISPECIES: FAD binding domain-containing protein [Rhodomicrobium]|uniref:FAD binding domain-containing protein n=1 Tax=Rhodomicrobium TaxID=1068 RepID=UPI000B4AAFDF|nr:MULTISPECIES: FAD binding domain-containing protein [Rhodomicrobium]